MTNENILDDNLTSIDKPFVRTERIQQVEKVAIVGSIILFGMQIWTFMVYGLISIILVGAIIGQMGVFVAVIWWRKVSIEFDANTSTLKIFLPQLLILLRIMIPLYNGWVLLSSLFTFHLLYRYLFTENTFMLFDLRSYILRMLFSLSMAFLYIYYWRITKESMDFINK